MSSYDFDLFVIGAGSGGVRASRMAAAAGKRVAVAEERHLGGTCVNIGCVPKKLMVYASHFREEFEQAAGFGWTVGDSDFDWSTLIANKNAEIARLNGIYENLLTKAGVEIVDGRATLVDPHTVSVDGRKITAECILVATGGVPSRSDEPGQELGLVSDDIFFLEKQPERILVVGGGYIAVEFAGIFSGLGSKTTLVYRGPLFLRGFDEDLREFLAREMPKKGVNLRFNLNVSRIEETEGGRLVHFSDGSSEEFDQVLYAIGRAPNTESLGLEEAGVALTARGAVKIDPYFRSNVPSIFAIGDVTDRLQLTPVAIAEAMAIVRTLCEGQSTELNYENIPSAVFSQPPLATVGLTEAQAREQYREIDIYRTEFRPMKHTLSGSDERTIMKLVVDRHSQKVLGAHMGGMDAAEIIQGVAIAIKAGATKRDFDATVGIHPTAAEEFVTMRTPVADSKGS
ncbi:glutathione-disulfide reductase [Aquibaculum arenosum]|uniref:Glutathione reductase n=1 Tax=Aquibaculum arenosum TaxID=3032591 RepID=A0ABT5YMS5_9PROT|nr:glutathione-disulfide reductase [Fodinicurvata sp. CAU 1616]MDF2096218.1 glutathione-disulfide reductase [Fodinicurvata sp. CAU 1616]